MKVYIKPWEEALKSAKEFDERLVDTINSTDYIYGVHYPYGDWGHIVEAKKENNGEIDYYDVGFYYPACCVEEITPDWLEEHASKFAEEIIVTESVSGAWDKDLRNYKIYRITTYKVMNAFCAYFFYVKRISYNNGYGEAVEEFREIK